MARKFYGQKVLWPDSFANELTVICDRKSTLVGHGTNSQVGLWLDRVPTVMWDCGHGTNSQVGLWLDTVPKVRWDCGGTRYQQSGGIVDRECTAVDQVAHLTCNQTTQLDTNNVCGRLKNFTAI